MILRIICILPLFLWLLVFDGISQGIILLETDEVEISADFRITPQGNKIVSHQALSPLGKAIAVISLIDTEFELVWKDSILYDDSTDVNIGNSKHFISLADSKYAAFGSHFVQSYNKPFVSIFDETIGLVQTEFLDVDFSFLPHVALRLSNGNILIGGAAYPNIQEGPKAGYALLDSSFNVIQDTVLTILLNRCRIMSLAEYPDGDVALGFQIWEEASYDIDVGVMKYDITNSLITWTRTLPGSDWFDGAPDLLIVGSNTLIAAGIAKEHLVFSDVKGRITNISSTNDIVWSKEYGIPSPNSPGFTSINYNLDSSEIWLSGSNKIADSTEKHVWIFKVNTDGDSLGAKVFPIERAVGSSCYSSGFIGQFDPSTIFYTVFGTVWCSGPTSQDIFFLTVDSNLCEKPLDSCLVGVGGEVPEGLYRDPFNIFPVPSLGLLKVQALQKDRPVSRILIHDHLGHLVYDETSRPARANWEINVRVNGLGIITIIDDQGKASHSKIMFVE